MYYKINHLEILLFNKFIKILLYLNKLVKKYN